MFIKTADCDAENIKIFTKKRKTYNGACTNQRKSITDAVNVIKNNQGSSNYGAVYGNIKLDIYDSCVIENEIPYSLYIYT